MLKPFINHFLMNIRQKDQPQIMLWILWSNLMEQYQVIYLPSTPDRKVPRDLNDPTSDNPDTQDDIKNQDETEDVVPSVLDEDNTDVANITASMSNDEITTHKRFYQILFKQILKGTTLMLQTMVIIQIMEKLENENKEEESNYMEEVNNEHDTDKVDEVNDEDDIDNNTGDEGDTMMIKEMKLRKKISQEEMMQEMKMDANEDKDKEDEGDNADVFDKGEEDDNELLTVDAVSTSE